MLKQRIFRLAGSVLLPLLLSAACTHAWECAEDAVPFTHKPSDYYGSGEYFTVCPETDVQIRCYHYHRHWVCEKGDVYFWDRNLDSAARTACGCPLPEGVAPASPAVSGTPASRFHDVPAQE
ncbi:hypothetical protein DSCA_29090 [Desulfosarcina alkanivorans]|uniref:Lipoprotein n=1 Tax=Desulfosarcina alkanivorans TaxID=571177 RepID=A0A5K7YM98_9BACT|nr:hypothetical protein [Desulfosarcina alkanivorans]BBO68979.1 hypothetical protein DSCA_29090 [Desulfosarcina alkanivorans]